jgi:hypothetical protein
VRQWRQRSQLPTIRAELVDLPTSPLRSPAPQPPSVVTTGLPMAAESILSFILDQWAREG